MCVVLWVLESVCFLFFFSVGPSEAQIMSYVC
jgi:hypothetical protein